MPKKARRCRYLEGCTAPKFDTNQLHAAVVELVALDDADIKYSTVQNWYAGDENGVGGIYNFVTKRGLCRGVNSRISWTQVETGSAITWKYPSCVLLGDNSVGEFYSVALTNHHQQADTGTKMIHIGKNTRSTIVSKGISAGQSSNSYRGLVKILPTAARRAQLLAVRLDADRRECGANTFPYIQVRNTRRAGRARGLDVEDRRRPVVLFRAARHRRRGGRLDDHQRLLQGRIPPVADGIRGRGDQAARSQARRERRMITPERPSAARGRGPHGDRQRHRDPEGPRLQREGRRSARDHGAERLGQEHLREGARRPPAYEVTAGQCSIEGRNLLELTPEARARAGVFLAFQYPIEIPGVGNSQFLRLAYNTVRPSAATTSSTRSNSTTWCARR